MKLFDAHNHLHDARLDPWRAEIERDLRRLGVAGAVVNGTRESDWDAVAALARREPWIVPSYGLHPWHVGERQDGWLENLRQRLVADPRAAVGEIGLDRWIEGHDDAAQAEVFEAQLALAAELDRPATIHCLRAWGALAETLRCHPRPARGFLIHAYAGSLEMMREFTALGASFSFNAYFLLERKAAQREVFRHVPLGRLLVETDAPAMPPPPERNSHPLTAADGAVLNHPTNLLLAYEALAELRELRVEPLAEAVQENFARLFHFRGI